MRLPRATDITSNYTENKLATSKNFHGLMHLYKSKPKISSDQSRYHTRHYFCVVQNYDTKILLLKLVSLLLRKHITPINLVSNKIFLRKFLRKKLSTLKPLMALFLLFEQGALQIMWPAWLGHRDSNKNPAGWTLGRSQELC